MNKIGKVILGGALFGGLAFFNANMYTNKVFATSDITPPRGVIQVEGATLRDGVYYTKSLNITINIDIEDDTTAKNDIKLILSDEPVEGADALDDSNWTKYSDWVSDPSNKNWTLTDMQNTNKIYLYLKDEAENISPSITIDADTTFTVTYSGDGENMPNPKTAKYGMLFNVAIEEPTLENKYFLGWSAVKDGSVQWLSDSIIEPKYIKGDITLYAIYADEAPSLSSQVQIGDYVNYPVFYNNLYTDDKASAYKSSYTGWRVLDVSGDEVKLISAGTPLRYRHANNPDTSINALKTGFLDTQYDGSGFGDYHLNLTSAFVSGEAGKYTENVRSFTKEDLDKLIGVVTTSGYGIIQYGSLAYNGCYVWLASVYSSSRLWYVDGHFDFVYNYANDSFGVRPVVSLKSTVKATGRNASGMWKISM